MQEMIRTNQENMDAWIAKLKDERVERMACQEMTEANPEKMEPHQKKRGRQRSGRRFLTKRSQFTP
jgi:hypothetical protein